MSTIKRLDVPMWVKTEKIYYDFFGYTRRHINENESFDDYHSMVISELGYSKGVIMFPGKDGYFLINNSLVIIQYNGLAWVSLDKDKVSIFKQELKKHNLPSISSEVFKSLGVLSREGFLKYNDDLYELYNLHRRKNAQWKRRKSIQSEKRKRMKVKDT
jgi:hypothetical protein